MARATTSATRGRRALQHPTSTPKKSASSVKGVATAAATRLRSKRLSVHAATARVTRLPHNTIASRAVVARRATRRRLKPAAPIATPSLWPQDQTGIVALSERVVIEIEAASFIITWAVLSAALTAIVILILLRAPILL